MRSESEIRISKPFRSRPVRFGGNHEQLRRRLSRRREASICDGYLLCGDAGGICDRTVGTLLIILARKRGDSTQRAPRRLSSVTDQRLPLRGEFSTQRRKGPQSSQRSKPRKSTHVVRSFDSELFGSCMLNVCRTQTSRICLLSSSQ